MATQVPRVERFDAQATPSVGRTNINLPDVNAAVAPQRTAANNFVEKGVEVYDKFEDDTADTTANNLTNQFEMYANERLEGPEGARFRKGDPGKVYEEFDADIYGKYEELIASNPNMSAKTRAKVQSKLGESYTRVYNKRTLAYGKQFEDYEVQTTNTSVALLQRDMMDTTRMLDVNDPNTLVPLNNNINAIVDARYKSAEKTGLAFRDPETGRLVTNKSVDLQVAKDVTEGLTSTIENLNNANRPDLAELVMKRYGAYLDPENEKKVLSLTEKTKVEVEALDLLRSARTKKPDDPLSVIDKATNEEVRSKAIKLFNSDQAAGEAIVERQQKKIYNTLANIVSERQRTDPFVDITAMESDPDIKPLLNKMTDAKQKDAIYKMIKAPNVTDPDSFDEMIKSINDGTIRTMDVAEYNRINAGLDRSDRARFFSQYTKYRSDTNSQQRADTNYVLDTIKRKADQLGMLKTSTRGKGYTKPTKQFLGEMEREVLDRLETLPSTATPKEKAKIVDEILAEKVKAKPKKSGWGSFFDKIPFLGGATESSPEPVTTPAATKTVETTGTKRKVVVAEAELPADTSKSARTKWTSKQWREAFETENPGVPVTLDALKEYKRKNK